MPPRPPVTTHVTRYHRDERIEQGCVSERAEIAAPAIELTDAGERFEEALLQGGMPPQHASKAALSFDNFCEAEGSRLAVDAVREILLKIAETKTGKTPEFRAILAIFSPDRTQEDIAEEAGISRQSMSYHVEKLRPFFALPPALVEPQCAADDNER